MMDKTEKKLKIGALQLGLSYAGSVLGAGYVSGQELMQYFVSFGYKGIAGLILALILLGILACITYKLSFDTGYATLDALVVRKDIPWLKDLIKLMVLVFNMLVSGVMAAGIGSLLADLFGISAGRGAAAALILNAFILIFGYTGLVSLFSFSVPVLILCAAVISCLSISSAGTGGISLYVPAKINPMLSSWGISSLNYAFLNYFGMISVIAPIAVKARNRRSIIGGSILGTVLLAVIGLFIVFALYVSPEYCKDELPMLSVAASLGNAPKYIYAFLLFLGMFQNCVACNNVIVFCGKEKYPIIGKYIWIFIVVLCAGEYIMSMMGFSSLIAVIYPISGYLTVFIVILVIEHMIHVIKNRKKTDSV